MQVPFQFLFAAVLLCVCVVADDSHANKPHGTFAAKGLSRRRHGARTTDMPHSTNKLLRRADPTDQFSFSITLKGKNMDGLTQKMYEISESNGHWMTTDQLKQYTAPKEEHAKAFQDWLQEHQVSEGQVKMSPLEDHFTITADVATVEKMFSTQVYTAGSGKGLKQQDSMSEGKKTATGTQTFRTDGEFKVPASLQDAVAHVAPLHTHMSSTGGEPVWRSQAHLQDTTPPVVADPSSGAWGGQLSAGAAGATVCNTSSISAECVRSTYKIDTYEPKPVPGVPDLGIIGWIGETFQQKSLTKYLQTYRPEAANYTVPVYIAPGSKAEEVTGEGDLDIQMAVGMTWPLNVTWLSLGNPDANDRLIAQKSFEDLIAMPASLRPGVLSFSYETGELIGADIVAAACTAAQKLTALGTTLVFSSGDGGYGCSHKNDTHIPAYFPSSCPYVLSVGGTEPTSYDAAPQIEPEILLGSKNDDSVESGIGISAVFDVPDYQKPVLLPYLNSSSNKGKGSYRDGGRWAPDISTLGSQFTIYTTVRNEQWRLASGTSVSAPLMASLLALVNSARREKGLGNVGFAHPTLYKGKFTDITKGSLYECQMPTRPGFVCTEGFDIAGLGSPRLTDLLDLFLTNGTQTGTGEQ